MELFEDSEDDELFYGFNVEDTMLLSHSLVLMYAGITTVQTFPQHVCAQ